MSSAPVRRSSASAWLLVLTIAAIYGGSVNAPLLFDDAGAITHNASIRSLATAFHPPADGSATTGRPVVNVTFALSYVLSGDVPWGHRLVNIAIHAASALTLLGLARRMWAGIFPDTAEGLAFGLALLWAVHPLQTESVTCIAQRTESLCGFFYLFTFYAFVRGSVSSRGFGWLAASVVSCLLGMGTKEVMVSAPLLVLLYDRTFVAGTFAAAWHRRKGYYLALAATWLFLLFLVLGGGGTRGASAGMGLGVSWWTYLLKQAEALTLYLKLSVWPHPLVLDYGTAVVKSPADVWWQGVLVWSLVGGTLWSLWRRPAVGFAGAVFFSILAPSSSVIPLVTQTMAEHRMYLPLIPVLALGLAGLHRLAGSRTRIAWSAVAVLFCGLTLARNRDYGDTLVIWADTVEKYPSSARARNNLAVELQRRGRATEALAEATEAVALQSDYVPAHYIGGLALLDLGRVDEAITRLETALKFGPTHSDALLALGNALMRAQRPEEAVARFEACLALQPAADVHHNLAMAHLALGRADAAERHLRAAVQLDPALLPARRRLGLTLAQAGRLLEAGEQFMALVELVPDDADNRANYGNVLLLTGRPAEAVAQYEAALRLRPGDARTEENLRLAREALAGR